MLFSLFILLMTFQVVEQNFYLDKDDLFYLCTGLSSEYVPEFFIFRSCPDFVRFNLNASYKSRRSLGNPG